MKDKIKSNRIIGLVIGLIGLVILFYFRFDYRFGFTSMQLRTPMGELIYEIIKDMTNDTAQVESDRAIKLWGIFQIFYLALVWFYRGRIGQWIIKTIKLIYKKI